MKKSNKASYTILYLLTALAAIATITIGKVVDCSPDLAENPPFKWAFCTKMAFARDNLATVKGSVKWNNPEDAPDKKANVSLFIFKEHQWE